MKLYRALPLLLAGLMALALCACGSEPAAEEVVPQEIPAFEFDANFSPEETMAMSNFNACGIAMVEDNVFYGRWLVDGNDNFQLVRIDLVPEGDFLEPGDWAVLHEDTYPNYINKVGDTIYFFDQGADGNCVARVDADGQNYTVLVEDGFDFLSLHNNRLYFSDDDHNYCSTDLDGGDRQTVLEGSVYDPYFLTDDWFLFRDMNDGESLHLYNIENGRNETLYAGKTSPAILWGTDLFFGIADADTEGAYHLAKMDLSAISVDENGDPVFPEPEQSEELFGGSFTMGRDGYLYGGTNGNGSNAEDYWKVFKDSAYEEGRRSAYLFFSQDNEIRDEYNEEGLLNAMYVYNTATGGGNSFGKLK